MNFLEHNFEERFDLVVMNPPFVRVGSKFLAKALTLSDRVSFIVHQSPLQSTRQKPIWVNNNFSVITKDNNTFGISKDTVVFYGCIDNTKPKGCTLYIDKNTTPFTEFIIPRDAYGIPYVDLTIEGTSIEDFYENFGFSKFKIQQICRDPNKLYSGVIYTDKFEYVKDVNYYPKQPSACICSEQDADKVIKALNKNKKYLPLYRGQNKFYNYPIIIKD